MAPPPFKRAVAYGPYQGRMKDVYKRQIHLKLNELIRAMDTAHNQMIDIERLSDLELDAMQATYEKIKTSWTERQKQTSRPVSYTHLTQPPVPRPQTPTLTRAIQKPLRRNGRNGRVPVSYTHLDVYKRQELPPRERGIT